MRLQGKVALITGGNVGIGRATALRFAAKGAQVMIAARDAGRAQAVVDAIAAAGGSARFVACDVRDPAQCAGAVSAAIEAYGRLDILVNNAGIILRNRSVLETSIDEWEDIFAVNSKGAFLMSKAALPHLLATKGNIVNVASYAGLVGFPGAVAYCASKGALIQLTRAMALDHARQGVRVNCVCPGSVHTPMIEAAWELYGEGAPEAWAEKHPLGRIATPEEVAAAILFLASADADFVTGVALPVDGGITAG
ncbi:MAG: SDR family oxidoreductase [Anaerolineae bacterium]|nr:SDR family oxidoreductase [Anaerolineae bacterium]